MSPSAANADLLAPGLYAWAITVAWPAAQRLAPFESRLLAGAALVALVAGALLSRFWPFAARIAGLWLFVACSLGAWVLLARSIAPAHLDPVHGLLGSLGWAAFAVVWAGDSAAGTHTQTTVDAITNTHGPIGDLASFGRTIV